MNKIIIAPESPYNFELSLDFLIKDDKHPSPEFKKDGNLWRIFRIGSRKIPVRISSVGTIEEPTLKISTTGISPIEEIKLREEVERYLNLEEDLSELYAFMEGNERLRNIREALYGFKAPTMGTTIFEMIIKAITQQQIAGRIAFYMISKMVKKFTECIIFGGYEHYDFPTPEALAKISISDLRSCGVSERKAEYIINFSKEVAYANFDPEVVRGWDFEKIIERLTEFRGIGKWTAELIAAASGKGYGPADDLGLKRALSEFYFDSDANQNPQEIGERISEFPKGLAVYMTYARRKGILQRG